MCSKLIFCSKIAQKDKKFPEVAIEPPNVTPDAKSYSKCGCEWRHMIAVAMNITTKRLIIHEAESTHKYHHKHPLESFRKP